MHWDNIQGHVVFQNCSLVILLVRRYHHLLAWAHWPLGMGGEMVQGEARDFGKTQGQSRQIWRVAGAHQLGAYRWRCLCHRFGFLQGAAWLDNAAHADWKVPEVLDLEFDNWGDLNC